MLLYDVVACPMNKSDLKSLDFTADRLLMKLFKTGNIEIVTVCHKCFGFELPSVIFDKRCNVNNASENVLRKMCGNFM